MFKRFVAALLLSLTAFAAMAGDILNPYGKFLYGDSLEVEMATFNEKNEHGLNDVLIRVRGAAAYDAGIDGMTYRYKTIPAGTGFNIQKPDGSNLMIVRSRGGWFGSWNQAQMFLNGKTFDLWMNESAANDVNVLHLLGQYNESLKEGKK